ncbi:MAG TPA: LptF/LptG family permease [Devosia sp.]|nr:LptF/LptG family permease [Devosia sp.]
MSRLARYLLIQFTRDSLALYLVAAFLVWITQMLRLFDLVTAKGQDMFTLAGQAFLTTPPLAREIVYICMGIGLARAFRSLQQSRELHTIHISRRVPAIWSALFVFSLGGALIALFISNWAEPASRKTAARWSAEIAADLLGRTLTPGRFTEFSDGLVLHIGGRRPDGTIVDFFADDSRADDVRRTYLADSAIIISGEDGFQISLRDGRLQVLPDDDRYSEVAFARYDLAIASLTDPVELKNPLRQRDTATIVRRAVQTGNLPDNARRELHKRMAEGTRVVGISLLVAALTAFPHARRKREILPLELLVLAMAFAERAASNFAGLSGNWGYYSGPAAMLTAAVLIFGWRLAPRGLPDSRGAAS